MCIIISYNLLLTSSGEWKETIPTGEFITTK